MSDNIDISSMLDVAHRSYLDWSRLTHNERASYLLKVREVIYQQKDRIADVICKDTGKPKIEALAAEVIPVLELISYFSKRAKKILKPKKLFLHLLMQKKSMLYYEPYGVVLILSPWNFPFTIPMGDIVLALLAGNSVILKTSEVVPTVAKVIQEVFTLAGVPSGVVQVSSEGPQVGQTLVSSTRIQKISFTGSTAVGRRILEQAAKNITPSLLELGGKDAALVCEDAPIKKAASGIVWGAFNNAGQVCASVQRVYVHRNIVQSFVDEVILNTENLQLERDIGAITLPSQIERYQRQLEDALNKGAKILVGGMREKRQNRNYFQPTVLINVTPDMLVMREETFGPLLPIMMVDSYKEAIEQINDSIYGLCASVWTQDKQQGLDIAKKIHVGTVTLNDVGFTHALCETPWGGVKQSGIGRTHSDQGLREFCQIKHVNWDRISMKPFWWFPYTPQSYQLILEFGDFVGAPRALDKLKSGIRFLVTYLLDR